MCKKILFCYPINEMKASFVRRDVDLLVKYFKVTELYYDSRDKLFFWRVIKHLYNKDVCFAWFGGKYVFELWLACKLLGKSLIIVAGGYDVAYQPEIKYGLKYEKAGWRRVYFAFRHANKVLAVSKWTQEVLRLNCRAVKNVEVLYHGFDGAAFHASEKKNNTVLLVGYVNWPKIEIKGMITFIKAAAKLPETIFVLAGGGNDGALEYLRSIATSNVRLLGSLQNEEIVKTMGKAKVYVQISYVESFGCALAEAMLCECVPVVTRRGALPEVAGEAAFYTEYGDVDGTVEAIKKALVCQDGAKFRERIMREFPIEAREKYLRSLITG
ncbi:MAG: glycosyltransferase [bacterium]